jgi:penicillin-binding protein 1A
MADAYATVADGGWRNRPTIITKVRFPDGHSELPARWRVHRVKAFPDGVTYEATKILEDNIQMGTGTHANIGCPAAGKTGTTDSNTDAWFVGFTPKLATAVWVGYPNDRTQMTGLYHGANVDGGTYPADIWSTYMSHAKGSFCGAFPLPTQPFTTSPFYGKYSRTGIRGQTSTAGPGTTAPAATAPAAPTPSPTSTATPPSTGNGGTGTGGTGGSGGAGFDPNAYQSPPAAGNGTGPPG